VGVFYALRASPFFVVAFTTLVFRRIARRGNGAPAFSVSAKRVWRGAFVTAGATVVRIEIQVCALTIAVRGQRLRTGWRRTGPTATRRSTRASVLRECDRSGLVESSSSPINVRAPVQGSRRLKPRQFHSLSSYSCLESTCEIRRTLRHQHNRHRLPSTCPRRCRGLRISKIIDLHNTDSM
jgi:hypothetical protein